jgi:hypothetical protein
MQKYITCCQIQQFSQRLKFGPLGTYKLHNEELHNLYSSRSIIREIKSRRMCWARHVARMGDKRNAYRILVGKLEGKRLRWVGNIKMDLRERGWGGMDWTICLLRETLNINQRRNKAHHETVPRIKYSSQTIHPDR